MGVCCSKKIYPDICDWNDNSEDIKIELRPLIELTKVPLAFDIPKLEDIPLEQMAICLQENFTDTSSEKIERYFKKIKQRIISTFPKVFDSRFKLSFPYKVDKWTKLPQYKQGGIYMVIGLLEEKESICRLRYLIYIKKEKIIIIEKNIRERKVKPSAIISSYLNKN